MGQEPRLFFDLPFFVVPSCVGQGQSGSPSVLSNASNRMQLNIFDLRWELRIETFWNFNGHVDKFIFRILVKSWDLNGCLLKGDFQLVGADVDLLFKLLSYWSKTHLNHLATEGKPAKTWWTIQCHLMALARRRSKGTYGPLRRNFKRLIWPKWIREGLMNTFTFMTCKRQISCVCVWWKKCGKAIFKMRIFLPLLVVTNTWWILDLDWFNGRFNGLRKACENTRSAAKNQINVISCDIATTWDPLTREAKVVFTSDLAVFKCPCVALDVDRH